MCLIQHALERIERVKEKGYLHNFATTEMGRGGRGGPGCGNESARRGPGGRKSKDLTVPTHRATMIGACAELGGSIFTIISGHKARCGDTHC